MNSFSNKYYLNDQDFDGNHGVLKNRLGINDPIKLELQENTALIQAYEKAASEYSEHHKFKESDVLQLHRLFLGKIYEWAGQYRTVDLSSPPILWCHAPYIKQEMIRYSQLLASLTPFSPKLSPEQIIERLAQIHGELIVIHPFRDGNGRTTRLLCDLLLMQAEIEPIGRGVFEDKKLREKYHQAIQTIWQKKEYDPLIVLLKRVIFQH